MTKDGALSFAEFCTAMHLVVLRVRSFELPNELPAKLQPYAPLIDFNTDTTNQIIAKNKIEVGHCQNRFNKFSCCLILILLIKAKRIRGGGFNSQFTRSTSQWKCRRFTGTI